MSTYLWRATVLREFCSSTRLPFSKRGAVPDGPTSGHPHTPHQRPNNTIQYICTINYNISLRDEWRVGAEHWVFKSREQFRNLEKHFGGRDPASAVGCRGEAPHRCPASTPQRPTNSLKQE